MTNIKLLNLIVAYSEFQVGQASAPGLESASDFVAFHCVKSFVEGKLAVEV